MNTLTRSSLAFAGVALIALTLALAFGSDTATAAPGEVGVMAVDLDSTGNSATAVGTIEGCRNDLVDGNTFTLDITVNAVDPADGVNGISFNLMFNSAVLQVNSRAVASDIIFMQSAPVGTYFELSDPLPGTDGDYRHEATELGGPATFESGPGVIARFVMEVVGSGVSDVTLDDTTGGGDGVPNVLDSNANPLAILQLSQAQVRSDGSACGAVTDTPTPLPTPTPDPGEVPTDTPIPSPTPTGAATPTRTSGPTTAAVTCNTVMAPAAAGATSIAVLNPAGCNAGDTIRLGSGPTQEDAKIASVNGNIIVLVAPLTKSHAQGETVVEVSTTGGASGATTAATPRTQPATGGGSGSGMSAVLLVAMSVAGVAFLAIAGGSFYLSRIKRPE